MRQEVGDLRFNMRPFEHGQSIGLTKVDCLHGLQTTPLSETHRQDIPSGQDAGSACGPGARLLKRTEHAAQNNIDPAMFGRPTSARMEAGDEGFGVAAGGLLSNWRGGECVVRRLPVLRAAAAQS